jgi:hypothetical protein
MAFLSGKGKILADFRRPNASRLALEATTAEQAWQGGLLRRVRIRHAFLACHRGRYYIWIILCACLLHHGEETPLGMYGMAMRRRIDACGVLVRFLGHWQGGPFAVRGDVPSSWSAFKHLQDASRLREGIACLTKLLLL